MPSEFTAPRPLSSTPSIPTAPTHSLDFSTGDPVHSYASVGRHQTAPPIGVIAQAGLQAAHRVGSLALLLVIGGAAAVIAGKHGGQPLFWAIGCANVGLLGAGVALLKARGPRMREARNAAIFNAVVLALAFTFFLLRDHLHTKVL